MSLEKSKIIPQFKINTLNISLSTIWLFHLSGIIGILYLNSSWFVSVTPLILTINFILLVLNSWKTKNFLKILILSFSLGFISELLGVNYGLIFGNYSYGELMGYKFFGVPILIGTNWTILLVCSASIAKEFSEKFWLKFFFGIGLMLLLDLLIEPIAPILDYWKFEGGIPTFKNYIGWFVVSFPLHFFFHYWKVNINSYFTYHLFLLQLLFFMILLLKINDLKIIDL
ncbi:MAG: carotenoid biosynthesis protein [Flavobacteriaceae bacterium]|nr:carotenoid biosynthesis protein [Flavobacteriaceae bacterium]